MPDYVAAHQILDHFKEGFAHTAWRLETRRAYASDEALDEYQDFLKGVSPRPDPSDLWFTTIERLVSQGKRIERVRLADQPMTDGQRFLLATTPENLAAGEDIRFLFRAEASTLDLPLFEDFWLFDSRVLARFNWGDPAQRLELTTDPRQVVAACQVRDATWHYALRYEDHLARVPSPV
ncbi:DUF6879 family protein [Streptomyces sp. NPDC057257]|uniref:DUF6879 family protein n=1 Tax=Streptomyces sp. NPDC057257 TaxID=3346071 RepID=UPI00363DD31D